SGADATAPVFKSAIVDGDTLVMTYDSLLKAVNVPLAGSFGVKAGESATSVTAVAAAGNTLVLTLAAAAQAGQTVTVSYTDPSVDDDHNAVQANAGNDAISLIDAVVANHTAAPDIVMPTLLSSTPSDDAANVAKTTNIILTFDEAVQKAVGNIVIRNSVDDSVVASIDIASDAVSIEGTV